ncbi:hypothetical protein CBL_05960 [Carabus blaptoides fortunei]
MERNVISFFHDERAIVAPSFGWRKNLTAGDRLLHAFHFRGHVTELAGAVKNQKLGVDEPAEKLWTCANYIFSRTNHVKCVVFLKLDADWMDNMPEASKIDAGAGKL